MPGFRHFELAIGGVEAGAVEDAVGEAGGVAQQVHHFHRLGAGRGEESAQDPARVKPQIGKAGNEARHRIVQRDLAFLHQHQQRHGGDGLGHGKRRKMASSRMGALAAMSVTPDMLSHANAPSRQIMVSAPGMAPALHIIARDHVMHALKAVGIEAVAGHAHLRLGCQAIQALPPGLKAGLMERLIHQARADDSRGRTGGKLHPRPPVPAARMSTRWPAR